MRRSARYTPEAGGGNSFGLMGVVSSTANPWVPLSFEKLKGDDGALGLKADAGTWGSVVGQELGVRTVMFATMFKTGLELSMQGTCR